MQFRCRHCGRIVRNPQGWDVLRLTVTCECGARWQYQARELPEIETADAVVECSKIEMIEIGDTKL